MALRESAGHIVIAALAVCAMLAGWRSASAQTAAPGPVTASPFSDWAAVVVAGDARSHSGAPSEVFDNARRDVVQALIGVGFSAANIQQFSVRPERYPDAMPLHSEVGSVRDALTRIAARAKSGCLVYLTSHGSPAGALVGDDILTPAGAASMISRACGERPSVVIISACFSGVFVPAVSAPNRMVLTAARPDRSSFGCGDTNIYPYFDDCILQSMPRASDFAALGRAAQACVAAREKAENLAPASEPQMAVGGGLRPILPLLALHQR